MSEFERALEEDLRRGVTGQAGALVNAAWLDPMRLQEPRWKYRTAENKVGGLILGHRNNGAVGSLDNRHVLTVAGSRGGKGVSLIVPNLLTYEGSVLAMDPKGELSQITARARRAMGQKVVILEPFPDDGGASPGSFNPLKEIDPNSKQAKDDAGQIADALITANERDPHWTDSARILVKALILFTLTLPEDQRHLITVWRLLNLTHPSVTSVARRSEKNARFALFKLLQGCAEFDGAVSGAGENFASMADKELASVFSSALTQLEFLSSDAMKDVLIRHDLSLSELKTGKTTLFLSLPATRMGTHARWLRVIINLALIAFERTTVEMDIPLLMVLDEFPVLGHMKSVETAAGLMAGFGVKLWIVLQDLTQAKRLYKESWETFIGNAGIATFWANADTTTLAYVSEKLGQTSVELTHSNDLSPQQRQGGATGRRKEIRVQKLASTDELERMLDRDLGRVLVLAAGQSPVIVERFVYYRDQQFQGLYDAPKNIGSR